MAGAGATSETFRDLFLEPVAEVNALQQQADRAVEAMAIGEDLNPAEVLTAVQKADLAFRMLMQVRNKLVLALDEIRNLRI
jgi:flagellar hook-basal body complex protein FliE